jgi:hypothetical protein
MVRRLVVSVVVGALTLGIAPHQAFAAGGGRRSGFDDHYRCMYHCQERGGSFRPLAEPTPAASEKGARIAPAFIPGSWLLSIFAPSNDYQRCMYRCEERGDSFRSGSDPTTGRPRRDGFSFWGGSNSSRGYRDSPTYRDDRWYPDDGWYRRPRLRDYWRSGFGWRPWDLG